VRTQRPGQSALLFIDVVELLNREHIDYLVIGAFALSVHGTVRGSVDVGALLHLSYPRIKKLCAAFEAAQFRVTLNRGNDEDPISSMLILSDAHGNRVDLLGGLRRLDPRVFTRAIEVPFRGINLRIVGREDFIAMKCFAGGPQDLVDARAAFEGARSPLDLDLLRTVARRFGRDAADRLESLLSPEQQIPRPPRGRDKR